MHHDAAIVFIDLSGFTSLSETLGLDAGLALLKDFHALVDAEVVAHGGVTMSFLGDGAMILFGLPESREDDAAGRRAARRALQPGRAMDRIAAAPIASRTGFKVGAHFGRSSPPALAAAAISTSPRPATP